MTLVQPFSEAGKVLGNQKISASVSLSSLVCFDTLSLREMYNMPSCACIYCWHFQHDRWWRLRSIWFIWKSNDRPFIQKLQKHSGWWMKWIWSVEVLKKWLEGHWTCLLGVRPMGRGLWSKRSQDVCISDHKWSRYALSLEDVAIYASDNVCNVVCVESVDTFVDNLDARGKCPGMMLVRLKLVGSHWQTWPSLLLWACVKPRT